MAVASAVPSVSQAYPLGILRILAFGAAIPLLLRTASGGATLSGYAALAAAFTLFAFFQAIFAAYRWVSLQHALNIAMGASALLVMADRFRAEPGRWWDRTVPLVVALGLCQTAVALGQRILLRAARPAGTFGNANYLSEFLAAGAVLAVAAALFDERSSGKTRAGRVAAGAILGAASLALAGSRAVLLAAVPAAALLLAARFGIRKGARLLLLAAVPAILLLGIPALERFRDGSDPYDFGRIAIWKAALRTFADDPSGVGLGGFKYSWLRFQEPMEGAFRLHYKTADNAHNEYLEVLAGLGVAGFPMFLALLLAPLARSARRFRHLTPERRKIAAGCAACLVLSGINALFNANFHEPGIVLLDAWLLSLLLAVVPDGTARAFRAPPAVFRACAAVLSALLLYSTSTLLATLAHGIGQSRLRSGLPGDAGSALRVAAALDPLRAVHPDALSAAAFLKYRSGRKAGMPGADSALDESIRWEERAAALAPVEPAYPSRLASLHVERFRAGGNPSDLAVAERRVREAIRLSPFAVERYWQLADILEIAGRRDEAAGALRTAVGIEPNFCQGYARLSAMAAATDPERAGEWASKAATCRGRAAGLALAEPERWMLEVRFRDEP